MKYIVLRGLEFGQVFFAVNFPEQNPTIQWDGTVAYEVIGYAETIKEAQTIVHKTLRGLT